MPILNISIIGAGQIGSRHLQALANLKESIRIQLVDPSKTSLDVACKRFYSAYQNEGKGGKELQTFNKIEDLEDHQDVTIVATDASVRSKIIKELLQKKNIKAMILEKFLFQTENEYHEIGSLLKSKNVPTWVNCVLRSTDFFLKLKTAINCDEEIRMRVEGINWGLASNSIHFLDLFSYFTECGDFQFTKINFKQIEPYIKRPSYKEFLGEMEGKNSKGHHLFLSCEKKFPRDMREKTLRIDNGDHQHIVIIRSDKIEHKFISNNKETKDIVPMPFQSQITHKLVEKIIHEGTCGLPIYENSMILHLCLIKTFLYHLRKKTGNNITQCPIT